MEGTPRSGVRGTPIRQRPDLGSARKARQVDLHSDGVGGYLQFVSDSSFQSSFLVFVYVSSFSLQPAEDLVTAEQSLGQRLVIWGTDVNVASCKEKFQVS